MVIEAGGSNPQHGPFFPLVLKYGDPTFFSPYNSIASLLSLHVTLPLLYIQHDVDGQFSFVILCQVFKVFGENNHALFRHARRILLTDVRVLRHY